MKAEAYAHLHAFSAAFEQAWEAAQKLQPHFDLTRGELKRIYFRLQETRLETLVVLTELSTGYERAAEQRIQKQKAKWEDHERQLEEREREQIQQAKHEREQLEKLARRSARKPKR